MWPCTDQVRAGDQPLRLLAVDTAEIALDIACYHKIRLDLLKQIVVKKKRVRRKATSARK
jgi:hypothetical protein